MVFTLTPLVTEYIIRHLVQRGDAKVASTRGRVFESFDLLVSVRTVERRILLWNRDRTFGLNESVKLRDVDSWAWAIDWCSEMVLPPLIVGSLADPVLHDMVKEKSRRWSPISSLLYRNARLRVSVIRCMSWASWGPLSLRTPGDTTWLLE